MERNNGGGKPGDRDQFTIGPNYTDGNKGLDSEECMFFLDLGRSSDLTPSS